jgi:hypothetical protein
MRMPMHTPRSCARTRRSLALAILSLLTLVTSPAPSGGQDLACAGTPKRFSRGELKSCQLSRADTVLGFALPSGSQLHFETPGILTWARISRETAFGTLTLPPHATVFFNRQGQLRGFWLHEEANIQGYLIPGHEDGVGNKVLPDGTLRAVWLAHEEVIDDVPCASAVNVFRMGFHVISLGTQRMAWLYDDGRLQQAMIARDIDIQGHAFKAGDVISLRRDGTIDLTAPKLQ